MKWEGNDTPVASRKLEEDRLDECSLVSWAGEKRDMLSRGEQEGPLKLGGME